jgi:hypothetical protein
VAVGLQGEGFVAGKLHSAPGGASIVVGECQFLGNFVDVAYGVAICYGFPSFSCVIMEKVLQ